jgi:hypothetical protein
VLAPALALAGSPVLAQAVPRPLPWTLACVCACVWHRVIPCDGGYRSTASEASWQPTYCPTPPWQPHVWMKKPRSPRFSRASPWHGILPIGALVLCRQHNCVLNPPPPLPPRTYSMPGPSAVEVPMQHPNHVAEVPAHRLGPRPTTLPNRRHSSQCRRSKHVLPVTVGFACLVSLPGTCVCGVAGRQASRVFEAGECVAALQRHIRGTWGSAGDRGVGVCAPACLAVGESVGRLATHPTGKPAPCGHRPRRPVCPH